MWLAKLLAFLVVAYLAVVAIMFAAQTWLLFPTGLAGMSRPPLPASAERLTAVAADGSALAGVRIPPRASPEGEPLILLGFGGNAWNAESVALYLHGLFPSAEAVAFHYRGYAPSEGRPSAAGIIADAPLVHDAAIDGRTARVVAVGFSIGSGAAAALARERAVAGLILVTPFDSLAALAADLYPWLPVRPLMRHRMPVADLLREVDAPVAVVAAERDAIVPPRRTAALKPAIRNLVHDETVAGAGHNDLYGMSAFADAMAVALRRIEAVAAPD
ncbi:MAG: alpha/beta hydrolase [Alphaproteobacteria bacterium]